MRASMSNDIRRRERGVKVNERFLTVSGVNVFNLSLSIGIVLSLHLWFSVYFDS